MKPLTYKMQKDDILYYLHIPRTAGTSLIFQLDHYFDFNTILSSQRWDQLLLNIPRNFLKYRFVRGHFGYDFFKILPKKPIYITMLRKPDDVIISNYKNLQRYPHFRKRYLISKEESISALLLRPVIHSQENPQCRWLVADLNLLSKRKEWIPADLHEWMAEDQPEFSVPNISEEELFEIAKNRLLTFTFFGLVERYEESLFLLNYTFGWKPLRDTIRLNVVPDKKTDLSPEARKNLEERTKIDVKLYQFAQQLFESRYSQMVQDLKEKYYELKYDNMDKNNVVYYMLEKYYNDHYHEWHTELSSIDYDFGKVLYGSGWQEREIHPDSKVIFRWTGPDTKSLIDFPLKQNRDLRIQFHVLDSMSPDILNSLQLKVNDTPIEIKKSKRIIHKSKAPFEGIIPASVLNNTNYTRLTFQVNRTVSPKSTNPDSTDDRKMGLAFDWVKIFPI